MYLTTISSRTSRLLGFFIFYIFCYNRYERSDDNYDVAGSSPLSEGSDQGLSSGEQMDKTFGKVINSSRNSLKLHYFQNIIALLAFMNYKFLDMGFDLEK